MTRKTLVYLLLLSVLLVDQASKIWVKTNMVYGEEIAIFGWDRALIHFVENNGMAFGLSLGGSYGKLALTGFRLLAVGFLLYYLRVLVRTHVDRRILVGYTLILAGAIGNIIDSVFYGVVFSASTYHSGVAEFLPEGGGYAPLFFGRVVDMLYFPLAFGTYPDWLPLLGGSSYLFFRPVFNVADVAISVGVGVLLLGYYAGKEERPSEEVHSPPPLEGEEE